MEEKRIAFAALKVPSPPHLDLHITIARRFDLGEAERQAMQFDLERLIRPHLPIRVDFGNFCHLGENGSFPAYKVIIPNVAVWNLIKEYHQRYYREAPGKALYPQLKLHVTVDTPEKRDFFEGMIRTGQGYFMVNDTLFLHPNQGWQTSG
jgi:2'-5' RNA ligase